METIEVSSEKHENTKWNFWKLLAAQEDLWIKSVTDCTNMLLVEIGLEDGLVEDSVSLEQLSVLGVSDFVVDLFGETLDALSTIRSGFEILIETL